MNTLSPSMGYDVIVLGAGAAGLAAGVSLVLAGYRPLLVEAAKEPGGRARSHVDGELGETVDNGPHLLLGAYRETLALLELLGSRGTLLEAMSPVFNFWTPEQGFHQLACRRWPAPLHLVCGLWNFPALTLADQAAALRLGWVLNQHRHFRDLERLTVAQWLRRHKQTETLSQRLWGPICLAALNEPPATANAALFATVLKRAFFQSREAALPLLPGRPLSQVLAEPARRFIEERGGWMWCGRRVTGLEREDGRVRRVLFKDESWEVACPIIAALPWHDLARLLPEWSVEAGWAHLHASPIVSVYLNYRIPARLPAPLVGVPGRASQWLFDRNLIQAGLASGGRFAAVLSAAYLEVHQSREELAALVHNDLAALLPVLRGQKPEAMQVLKEHRATFSPWPGTTSLRPGPVTPWRNLVLAGDWTATGLPATLEGAVASGNRAARRVAELLSARGEIV